MNPRTVAEVIGNLHSPDCNELKAPYYVPKDGPDIMFAVEEMIRHMTNESWQMQDGLEKAGYQLWGKNYPNDCQDAVKIIKQTSPRTILVQDKREWNSNPKDFRSVGIRFENVHKLGQYQDIFKLTILKDAHKPPSFHIQSAEEMQVHAWVIYYHPKIVKHLAPYVRPQHLIRTTHSVDATLVPEYQPNRHGVLLSGAVWKEYPLRTLIERKKERFENLTCLPHPGYHIKGSATPEFLKTLSNFRVSICTSSMFGYTLRKLIESTACGCAVLTDLPVDEVMEDIDENFVRIHPSLDINEIVDIVRDMHNNYDPEKQKHLAQKALARYHYPVVYKKLAADIENLRLNYEQ